MMKLWPRSIRGRLTLWYAVALALVVVLISVTVYLLIRQRIIHQIETQLENGIGIVTTLLSGPGEGELEEGELVEVWLAEELQELAEQDVLTLVRIIHDGSTFFISNGWREAGLDEVPSSTNSDSPRKWMSNEKEPYLLITMDFQEDMGAFRVTVAVEAEALEVLRTLVFMFLFVFPVSLALAALGGYLIAGRVLTPIRTMVTTAEQMTSRRLSERLPVENPDDELGRLASVFNSMLSRLEKSFEQLRRFTAEASHALRTPLTAIRSVGEVGLQEGDGSEFYRDLIGSMLEETDRLQALIENLLTLTRVEGGQFRVTPESIRLGVLAEESVGRLHILADEKKQDLRLDIGSDPEVLADREMIRQALLNILDNAIRYTPVGGIVEMVVTEHPGGNIYLEVRDNGPGIAAMHIPHLFERFYRIVGDTEETRRGSGLGLAIAELAVQMNGGSIEVESEIGKGSVFRIVLPQNRIRRASTE